MSNHEDGIGEQLAMELESRVYVDRLFPYSIPGFNGNGPNSTPPRKIPNIYETRDMRISFDRQPRPCIVLSAKKLNLTLGNARKFYIAMKILLDHVIECDNYDDITAVEVAFGGAMRSKSVHFKYFVEPEFYIKRFKEFIKGYGFHPVSDRVTEAIRLSAMSTANNHAWHTLDLKSREFGKLRTLDKIKTSEAKELQKKLKQANFVCKIPTEKSLLLLPNKNRPQPLISDVGAILNTVASVFMALKKGGISGGWISLPRPGVDESERWEVVRVSIYEKDHCKLLGAGEELNPDWSEHERADLVVNNGIIDVVIRV